MRAAELFNRDTVKLEYRPARTAKGVTWYWALIDLPMLSKAIATGSANSRSQAGLHARSEAHRLGVKIAEVGISGITEAEEIPDLDADLLSVPLSWEDVCKQEGMKPSGEGMFEMMTLDANDNEFVVRVNLIKGNRSIAVSAQDVVDGTLVYTNNAIREADLETLRAAIRQANVIASSE